MRVKSQTPSRMRAWSLQAAEGSTAFGKPPWWVITCSTVMSRLPAEGAGAPKLGTHEAWRTVTRVSRENKEAPEQREWPMAVLSLLGLDRVAVVTAEAKLPQVGGGTGTAPGASPAPPAITSGGR